MNAIESDPSRVAAAVHEELEPTPSDAYARIDDVSSTVGCQQQYEQLRSDFDRAALVRLVELVAGEALEAGPQPDVHRRRVLGPQPAHALEHPGEGRDWRA